MAVPAWAHHSHNAYEVTKWTEMEGTVTEIHYLQPHSWVYLQVKDPKGGDPILWALEATGPNGIFRNGVTKEDVKVGDKIKARCHLLRDGSTGLPAGICHAGARRQGARRRRRAPGGTDRDSGLGIRL
mgnify:CR=1 FL=1